jgi:uracil-DNA glycosylase
MDELQRSAALREALGDDLDPVRHGSICPVHPTHKLALLGEAPGPNTRADLPFYPYPERSAAGRLLSILGWTRSEYLRTFARANVLDAYPGPTFPVVQGRIAAHAKARELAPRPILLMGKGVSASFMLPADTPILTWVEKRLILTAPTPIDVRVAIVPHTSGRNLFYNDPANRDAVKRFIEEARDAN